MGSRKRGRDEMESSEPAPEQSLLTGIRNAWEFSNLMQYIFFFGKAVKIDEDLTIEVNLPCIDLSLVDKKLAIRMTKKGSSADAPPKQDLETECLKPDPSQVLSDIGLTLLKYVSSHRGLTHEIFDEYTRRQYLAKAPARNPFGDDDTPRKFAEFDVFTKLRVLVQLSQWTLINADRMRQNMPETKDSEQTQWRIEEIGYDRDERLYFVLDDNRLYRRTDPTPPPTPAIATRPKATSKKGKAAARASKRRKTEEMEESAIDADGETPAAEDAYEKPGEPDDGFGGRKWECIAITLGEYQEFLDSIRKSRDPDEKELHRRITDDVLPVIEKAEESQLRKKHKQERELTNMQKLATAKRSSRLEAKMERERQELEAADTERKKKADLIAAKENENKQKKMDEARESRMMTREQRIKEREYKRILHEEELANLSEENKKVEAGEARLSERHLKTEMEKKKKELAALAEDDEWFFDCSKCGVHGTNLDDGTHSVACDKCNVWQHSACLGISQAEAEKDDFHFICHDCKRREEDAKKPKIPSLKFHIGSSSSPPSQKPQVVAPGANEGKECKSSEGEPRMPPMKKYKLNNTVPNTPNPSLPRPQQNGHVVQNGMHATLMNAPTLSPQGQGQTQVPRSIYAGNQGSPGPRSPSGAPAYANGYATHMNSNTYVPQLPLQAFQSPYQNNRPYQNNHQPQNVGWSARYTPPQQPQHQQNFGPPPPSQNPFSNSFDRQRPSSSHTTHIIPPPTKNDQPRSPPQLKPSAFGPSSYETPHTNGILHHQPLPATGPPVLSPVKQQSPPHAPPLHQSPSSSPASHQPPLQPNGPSSPGFSPTKHSPAYQSPRAHGVTGTPTVLPPAPQLSPSPRQHPDAATRGASPERMMPINGQRSQQEL